MPTKRVLFLDRDGVINADRGYIGDPTRFEFLPGLFPFLRATRDKGYLLAVLTNQSGVARGMFSQEDYENVTSHMRAALAREGITLDLILASFEHPEGTIALHRRESFWRKPNPGMVLDATRQLGANPAKCAFLGDNLRDMEAGLRGGIGTCLWLTCDDQNLPDGVIRVENFDQALAQL